MDVTDVRFYLVPAEVTITNEESETGMFHPKTAVYVTNKGIHLYHDSADGPVEAYQAPLLDFEGRATTGWTATTDDGDVIEFRRSSGCLCGSRLRGFDPFPGVARTNTLI